jgi:hypothetical protein
VLTGPELRLVTCNSPPDSKPFIERVSQPLANRQIPGLKEYSFQEFAETVFRADISPTSFAFYSRESRWKGHVHPP